MKQPVTTSTPGNEPSPTDTYQPRGKWAFDSEVTAVFDDMLARSIPQYEIMRRACFDVGLTFVDPKRHDMIIDLGSSRGEAVAPFVQRYGAQLHYTLVETSPPMLDVLRQRYQGFTDSGIMTVRDLDLRHDFPHVPATLAQSVLTLMFIPVNYRQQVIENVYATLQPGGAFILVEKVLGNGARIDRLMVDLYHQRKHEHDYSFEDIDRKAASLEGVLVPLTATYNRDLLRSAGFHHVDCFWRWMNFAAWVAIK